MNDRCPHCGASLKKYWQKLTPLLVKTLIKFRWSVVARNKNEVHVPKDFELTKTEYNNFQKLRFHGLVAKVKNKDGTHKTGFWLLTRRGADFLNGKQSIPSEVQTFRNKVVQYGARRVNVGDVIGSTPYLETIDTIEFDIENLDDEIHEDIEGQKLIPLADRTEFVKQPDGTYMGIVK